jgi:hypothetical protein
LSLRKKEKQNKALHEAAIKKHTLSKVVKSVEGQRDLVNE